MGRTGYHGYCCHQLLLPSPFTGHHYMIHSTVRAEKVKLSSMGRQSTNIKWGDAGTKYAVESTGVLTTIEKIRAQVKQAAHFTSAVPPCLLNYRKHDNSLEVVKNASRTTNCSVTPG